MSEPMSDRRATVLVYSSDERFRAHVRTALGVRPVAGLELELVEATTGAEVVDICDAGGIDLALLDGEAAPTGGLGLCRQLKDELDAPPPVLVVVGRRDDAWLATWCRADGVTQHPIDAMRITDAVVGLLRRTPRQVEGGADDAAEALGVDPADVPGVPPEGAAEAVGADAGAGH